MFSKQDVLFPTDFSPHARYAMGYAIAMAARFGGKLHVLHVIDASMYAQGQARFAAGKDEMDVLYASMREHAASRLEHVAAISEEKGVPACIHILRGVPWERTVALVEELGVGLVVIPTHGRSGFDRLVYGSVCERVIRHSPAPVLAIKHPEHEFIDAPSLDIHLKKVMFPTDFSEFSIRVLPCAVALCRMFGARLHLTHIAEPPMFMPEMLPQSAVELEAEQRDSATKQLEEIAKTVDGVGVDIDVRTGLPHRLIAEIVDEGSADLVVIPTHGRSGLRHMFFGSVAEKVVRSAPCPVMTIRPGLAPAELLGEAVLRPAQNVT